MRALLLFMILLVGMSGSVAAQQLEFKMISAVSNRPGVPIWAFPMREIMAGLHAGVPLDQMAVLLGLSQADVSARVDSMRADGVVTMTGGAARPSCMVVSIDESRLLDALAASAARDALPLMRAAVHDLRTRYRDLKGFAHLDFEDASFFLISNVLLDNWQIRAVERLWLKAERPLRGRARYYCAIFARADAEREAFGIYGNQVFALEDGRMIGVYGNRRGRDNELTSLSPPRLARLAAQPDTTSAARLYGSIVDRLVQMAGGARPEVLPSAAAELETLGLTRDGRPSFAVIDSADDRRLRELAAALAPGLVSFLERMTPGLRAAWSSSPWHAAVSFEEFAIWWYHFFYTELTDQLASEGALTIPESGLFHYILLR